MSLPSERYSSQGHLKSETPNHRLEETLCAPQPERYAAFDADSHESHADRYRPFADSHTATIMMPRQWNVGRS